MGFVKIFWKNDAQGAFLPKISISGQIALEIFLLKPSYGQMTPYKSF